MRLSRLSHVTVAIPLCTFRQLILKVHLRIFAKSLRISANNEMRNEDSLRISPSGAGSSTVIFIPDLRRVRHSRQRPITSRQANTLVKSAVKSMFGLNIFLLIISVAELLFLQVGHVR